MENQINSPTPRLAVPRPRQSGTVAKSAPNIEPLKTLALCAGVFVLAFLVRAWTNTWLTDFWGDSYHHWLITRLTMQHGGVYSDYKGLEVVWTPLYHYVSMIPLLLAGRDDLVPLHWMNALLGAATCALVAYLAWRLFGNRVAALAAGGVLALSTWHIAFSGMNVAETFSALLVIGVLGLVLGQEQAAQHPSLLRNAALLLLAAAMVLTRTDLAVYLAFFVIWLWIQRRYGEAMALAGGAVLAFGGWSAWSWLRTGNPVYWYQEYALNNLHDWLTLNGSQTTWEAFAAYLNRLSPFVLPALVGGVLCLLHAQGARRRNLWLVTVLLAGHSLFLIAGYARGIVPLLTERYLVMDLPLVAILMGGYAWLVGVRLARRKLPRTLGGARQLMSLSVWLIALVLMVTVALRFQADIPELEIRRWGIDQEWQIGNFLKAHMKPGDVALTDAPVAIYHSGEPLDQFVSSVGLSGYGDPFTALRSQKVSWIVTQTVSYDNASKFVPQALLQAQTSGSVNGLRFELVWRYDPTRADIQSEVWHVIE